MNPNTQSFGVAVTTPRWLYGLAAATGTRQATLASWTKRSIPLDVDTIAPGDVVGIGIHTGNAPRLRARLSASESPRLRPVTRHPDDVAGGDSGVVCAKTREPAVADARLIRQQRVKTLMLERWRACCALNERSRMLRRFTRRGANGNQ